ncbi:MULTISPECIES: ribonuclease HI family protein [Comamonas]|uniref:Ribonuclease H n=1 Tax=Comamonas terrigena TaxID=32013 RepID=A0A2A7UUW5_COMTR|nr:MULTISPECIES: ribonuclease HI family protein [Comamonas]MBD9530375.1 ribonuclease HI family protein [Comamonas sp. CMM01]MDH0050449.1 ribonuclease HI family protein [Comamonas terrigena]MDH0512905.1 ribonuclease HI family protein [Comamonas terrigena]MDH1092234.1 ribonuclease HI family protein [Comamonas terrigena]MDH1290929.1 ribonuclease HI family protein [Comamonas terrigena]
MPETAAIPVSPASSASTSAGSPDSAAPSTPWWTVHIDGSALPNPGRMALGAVLVSPAGACHTVSQDTHRTGCNNEAEVLALLAALAVLRTQQAQHARVYSDSSILVEQLTLAKPKPVVRLTPLYDQARAAVRQFAGVTLHWVPRHRNQQADALARAALQLPGAVPAPLAVKRKP